MPLKTLLLLWLPGPSLKYLFWLILKAFFALSLAGLVLLIIAAIVSLGIAWVRDRRTRPERDATTLGLTAKAIMVAVLIVIGAIVWVQFYGLS